MIRLMVEDYCQDCTIFEPCVRKMCTLNANMERAYDTHIVCENSESCARIVTYFARQANKED